MAKSTKKSTNPVSLGGDRLRGQIVLGALVAELLGSAVLAFAALLSLNNPIIAAVAVLAVIMIFGELSGGYLNPVVTVSAWAMKQMGWAKMLSYVVAQVIGAMLAYVIVIKFMQGNDNGVYTLFTKAEDPGVAQGISPARNPGEWKPVFGEFVGALIFSFGIASAFLGKKVGFERAFTIGGALLIGLLAALAGSYAVVNPALAVALGGFARGGWWSFAAYGLAPLAGGIVGVWLFKIMKRDVEVSAKAAR